MSKGLQHEEILARYLNREITENQLLQASEGLDEFIKLANMSENLSVPGSKSQAQAWQELAGKMEASPVEAKVTDMKLRPMTFFIRITAVGLVLLATFLMWPKGTEVNTSFDQSELVTLPDGSAVNMFSSSEISFKKSSWEKDRRIELSGEAYFDVEKGSTFSVETAAGTVEVLGTTFNVFQRKNELEVVCFSGKVKVQHADVQEILLPGEKVLLKEGKLLKTEIASDLDQPYWLAGEIPLEKANWELLEELLERYYGYDIILEGDFEGEFSGALNLRNVEEALKVICKPMDLSYIFEDTRIIRVSK